MAKENALLNPVFILVCVAVLAFVFAAYRSAPVDVQPDSEITECVEP